jgi:hypothetical protein
MDQKFFYKNKTILFILLILFFLLHRLGFIFFGYSHISHPGIDEPVSGVLACDILDGQLRAPLFAYEYLNRSGDVLIEGLLLVPYFKLFGRSIFSTKLFALTSALITFLCWFMFIKKYHGTLTAVLFGLLFALPPPLFARQNLIGTISSHHMLNPLIALQSLLLFKILEAGRKNEVHLWMLIVFGFLAGLGAYTFYTYILFLCFCGIVLLLFFPQLMHLRNSILMGAGFAVGFLPWVLRAVSNRAGGQFLASLLKNTSISFWSLIQNFGFAVPHSLGYEYPSRSTGIISVAFSLFILFCTGIILKKGIPCLLAKSSSSGPRISSVPLPQVHGLFCALFPLFFLTCLSLSPMRITPFEYWPNIGLFATFGVADAIRYRWLHILFPFYFATVAIGIVFFLHTGRKNQLSRLIIIFLFVFFIAYGIGKSIGLYSLKDFPKIFYYKGYNYDQFAPKFILGEFASTDIKSAESIAQNYPEVNKGEAYRSIGTLIAERVVAGKESTLTLEKYLEKVPTPYINEVIFGVVRSAHNVPEQKFQPLKLLLTQKYPNLYYENWGFQYLGHKYYGLLVNQEILFDNIPSAEQWFYRDFLNKFKRETTEHNGDYNTDDLLREIKIIPEPHQHEVVAGIGMRVGAEMLFDTLHAPDYPLDSRFGEQFSEPLREAFYAGVGSGFAETLCRFWRMQLLPENINSPLYVKLLDMEWNRCLQLMSRLPEAYYPIIKKGFLTDVKARHVPPGIKQYINNKLLEKVKDHG